MASDGSSLSLSVHPGNKKLHILRCPLGTSSSRSDSPIRFLVVRKEEERGMCPQNSSSGVWINKSWQVGQAWSRNPDQLKKDGKWGTERRQPGHFLGWAAADSLGREGRVLLAGGFKVN